MCTVIFVPRRGGYALGMNRDEQLTRVEALPPKTGRSGGRTVVCPSEPGGGTWIGLNDAGACVALINWYSAPLRVDGDPVSRGRVVPLALAADEPEAVGEALGQLPLGRVNPFRLIGIFPAARRVMEWRWDLKRLARRRHAWETGIWISSGFDERSAQRTRGKTMAAALKRRDAGTLAWLRALHRSHAPERGPYSICMHREDAKTVSYAEVVVSRNAGTMSYRAGPPCSGGRNFTSQLRIDFAGILRQRW
jgi:hypothetical protein